jgi:glycosyltransferase involved in cell wall biosynthesis
MVMIEALACGTPVIGTPRGSVPELIVDGVTGFVRDDDAGLVAALHSVADLDRRRCRKEAEERFSIDRMVQEHLALYRRVIGERRCS